MIIELFGLPGVGKTTFDRSCKNVDHIYIQTRRELFYWAGLFFIMHPYKSLVQLFYILKNSPSQKILYMKIMNMFLRKNALVAKAGRSKSDCVLIDEGHVQNILSMFEEKVSEETISRFIKCLVVPDHVLVLELDDTLRRSRLDERTHSIRPHLDKSYRTAWHEVLVDNYARTLNALSRASLSYTIVDVGSESTLENFLKSPCEALLKQ